jgi:hypothetical protein
MTKRFRSLQPEKVVETIERLERRIAERFPDANLRHVATELTIMAREATERAQRIGRPNLPLRTLQGILIGCCLALVTWIVRQVRLSDEVFAIDVFFQTVDGVMASFIGIGASILFVASWELRLKRRKALIALHELRSMAHIVDMHQLTKDPEGLLHGPSTASSPKRTMTPFELGRYLDYSSEMLSMISKTAAIYVQEFPDAIALEAVNEITSLTNGLSRNIWQKIMLIDRTHPARAVTTADPSTTQREAATKTAADTASVTSPSTKPQP